MRIAAREMQTNSSWHTLPIVYARFSILSTDIYIGQSVEFTNRLHTHTRETHKHHLGWIHDCAQPVVYTSNAQGKFGAQHWFTVPMLLPNNVEDLDHLEQSCIRKFGSLNNRVRSNAFAITQPVTTTRVKCDKSWVNPKVD